MARLPGNPVHCYFIRPARVRIKVVMALVAVLDVEDVGGGGGGSVFPVPGISPARAWVDKASRISAVAISCFIGKPPDS